MNNKKCNDKLNEISITKIPYNNVDGRNSISISTQQFCIDSNIILRVKRKTSLAGKQKKKENLTHFYA